MTLEEICDKSFDKIYDHLNKFYDNSKILMLVLLIQNI